MTLFCALRMVMSLFCHAFANCAASKYRFQGVRLRRMSRLTVRNVLIRNLGLFHSGPVRSPALFGQWPRARTAGGDAKREWFRSFQLPTLTKDLASGRVLRMREWRACSPASSHGCFSQSRLKCPGSPSCHEDLYSPPQNGDGCNNARG
jgi:hypothetical protein